MRPSGLLSTTSAGREDVDERLAEIWCRASASAHVRPQRRRMIVKAGHPTGWRSGIGFHPRSWTHHPA